MGSVCRGDAARSLPYSDAPRLPGASHSARRLHAQDLLAALVAAFSPAARRTDATAAPVEDKPRPRPTPGTPSTRARPPPARRTGGVTGAPAPAPIRSRDPNNILSKRSIYFDFDSFVGRATSTGRWSRRTRKYLAGQPQRARDAPGPHRRARLARVQHRARPEARGRGQADDDAARRAGDQVETVSFGKEKPRNMGHDEAAWAENRRVDIVYAGE